MNGATIQLIGSVIAIVGMVALAAWARIPRPCPPLDEPAVRERLAVEYPDRTVDSVWLAADGAGAISRSGDKALILVRLGDSWVARDMAWEAVLASPIRSGRVRLRFKDPAAPRLSVAVSGVNPWPPAAPEAELFT